MAKKVRNSEVHAYGFIKENLDRLGWSVKNPLKSPDGQVYTQQECLGNERIAEQLGLLHPENIVKVSETDYYIIEAKAQKDRVEEALLQAEHDYADRVNKSKHISAKLISGVAGNDSDGYIVKSKFLVKGEFHSIVSNQKELTSLLSPQVVKYLFEHNSNILEDVPIDEKVFLETAEQINVLLHNGAIAATERGRVMSALLLSLVDETQPNVNASPSVLIGEINARVNAVLQREGRPEFYDYIKISLPTTRENHIKFKKAIVQTIQELNNLNIRSAMNSGTDVLGNFYEVFLKYSNWAKEIGIVLTPRHITKFASEILDINSKDIIYDPTCGTGGFLVSAFDYVKRKTNPTEISKFKEHRLFGIEQEPSVVALAIVNMIFRGDGKNNIKEANCFHQSLTLKRLGDINTAEYKSVDSPNAIPPVSKVLMNPPFALKEEPDKEYKFIDHALKQMQEKGLLFSILPLSEMLQRGQYKTWRKELLEKNSLLVVITFPTELFYPIGEVTCGVVIKRGIPHPKDQKVLWLRAIHDGFVKRKGKRLKPKPPITERDLLGEYKEVIKQFIADHNYHKDSIPEEFKLQQIDFSDTSMELVPEVYLDEQLPSFTEIRDGIEWLIRETAGFLLTTRNLDISIKAKKQAIDAPITVKTFVLTDLCDVERKYAPYMNELLSDQKLTPYVTTSEKSNGIAMWCDTESNFSKNTVTVSLDGLCGTTFYQFKDYIAGEKTAVIKLRDDMDIPTIQKPHLLFYVAYIIRRKSWRYHYGRKLSEGRLKRLTIPLPVDSQDKIDTHYIQQLVENCYGWEVVKANLSEHF